MNFSIPSLTTLAAQTPEATATPAAAGRRSRRGFLGAMAFLLALPAVILGANVGLNEEVVVHVMLGAGTALLAAAAFDFNLPRRLAVVGAVSSAAFAALFFLQALSSVVESDALHRIAFDALGGEAEAVLMAGILAWLTGVVVTSPAGRNRRFGYVAVGAGIAAAAALDAKLVFGIDAPEALKAGMLLTMLWLAIESRRRLPQG